MIRLFGLFSLTATWLLFAPGVAGANGVKDWSNYSWTTQPFEFCPGGKPDANGWCSAYRKNWGDSNDQFAELKYLLMENNRSLGLLLDVQNGDSETLHFLCITALFLDQEQNNLYVFHQRHRAKPRRDPTVFAYRFPTGFWDHVSTLSIGVRQCQDQNDNAIAKLAIEDAKKTCETTLEDATDCKELASGQRRILDAD